MSLLPSWWLWACRSLGSKLCRHGIHRGAGATHTELLAADAEPQVNPRYVPQLQTVLTWPHSIGIIGGRPGSSLYFVGTQEQNVLFLDPHETQQVLSALSRRSFLMSQKPDRSGRVSLRLMFRGLINMLTCSFTT